MQHRTYIICHMTEINYTLKLNSLPIVYYLITAGFYHPLIDVEEGESRCDFTLF